MFTGIIQAVGKVASITQKGGDVVLAINTGELGLEQTQLGDSIAVNGVCLTAVKLDGHVFRADVSTETMNCTTLNTLKPGAMVNLEKALTLATPLGGHLVSGHVDGVGKLISRESDARSERLEFETPDSIAKYVAQKGAITIDGISLTVNSFAHNRFTVNIVPHTALKTTLAEKQIGDCVNLEVDLIARYTERLLHYNETQQPSTLMDTLQASGYIK